MTTSEFLIHAIVALYWEQRQSPDRVLAAISSLTTLSQDDGL